MEALHNMIKVMRYNAEMVKDILRENGITQEEIDDFIRIQMVYLFINDKKAFAQIMNNIFWLAFLVSGEEDEDNNQ
jgi:arginine/lysine/ornithine decarboxylase